MGPRSLLKTTKQPENLLIMLENKFSICLENFWRVLFLMSWVRASMVSTAAICTNWVITLCMSTVYVSDLGNYITVQLSDRSWTRSGSACFAFWLAGSGVNFWHEIVLCSWIVFPQLFYTCLNEQWHNKASVPVQALKRKISAKSSAMSLRVSSHLPSREHLPLWELSLNWPTAARML